MTEQAPARATEQAPELATERAIKDAEREMDVARKAAQEAPTESARYTLLIAGGKKLILALRARVNELKAKRVNDDFDRDPPTDHDDSDDPDHPHIIPVHCFDKFICLRETPWNKKKQIYKTT
jgi:hypothetical protein